MFGRAAEHGVYRADGQSIGPPFCHPLQQGFQGPGVAKAAGKAKAVKGEGEADSAKKPADANTDSADADNAGAENAPAAEADAPRKRRRTTE